MEDSPGLPKHLSASLDYFEESTQGVSESRGMAKAKAKATGRIGRQESSIGRDVDGEENRDS